MKIKKIGEIPKPIETEIPQKEIISTEIHSELINGNKAQEKVNPEIIQNKLKMNRINYFLGILLLVLIIFLVLYPIFYSSNEKKNIFEVKSETNEIQENNITKRNSSNKKIYKDTLVAIDNITKIFSNGYIEILYDQTVRKYVKLPLETINDMRNNILNYRIKYKIIPYGEFAEEEDINEYIVNIKSDDIFLIPNKYSISNKEYDEILNIIIPIESIRKECFEKVKNKRDILDIEFFDLNSDGKDEYIVWSSNTDCFMYNHAFEVHVLENKENSIITLYNDYTEDLEVINKITNGYFELEESGLSGRGRDDPEVVTIRYKFNGVEYSEARTKYKKNYLD